MLKISSRHDFTEFCSEVEVKLGRKRLRCRMQQVLKLSFLFLSAETEQQDAGLALSGGNASVLQCLVTFQNTK